MSGETPCLPYRPALENARNAITGKTAPRYGVGIYTGEHCCFIIGGQAPENARIADEVEVKAFYRVFGDDLSAYGPEKRTDFSIFRIKIKSFEASILPFGI
jgi:hypothetical protein